jgi:hypothetical protein
MYIMGLQNVRRTAAIWLKVRLKRNQMFKQKYHTHTYTHTHPACRRPYNLRLYIWRPFLHLHHIHFRKPVFTFQQGSGLKARSDITWRKSQTYASIIPFSWWNSLPHRTHKRVPNISINFPFEIISFSLLLNIYKVAKYFGAFPITKYIK